MQKCQLVTSFPCLKPFKSFPTTIPIKSRLMAMAFQILLAGPCSNLILLQPSSFPPHSLHCGHIRARALGALPHPGLSVLAHPLSGCPPYDSSRSSSFSYTSSAHCEVLATAGWMIEWLVVRVNTDLRRNRKKDFQLYGNPEGDRFQRNQMPTF